MADHSVQGESRPGADGLRYPTLARTLVIVLSQVVVIVGLVVLWSVLRGRRSTD
jgi:hypothetical protein